MIFISIILNVHNGPCFEDKSSSLTLKYRQVHFSENSCIRCIPVDEGGTAIRCIPVDEGEAAKDGDKDEPEPKECVNLKN